METPTQNQDAEITTLATRLLPSRADWKTVREIAAYAARSGLKGSSTEGANAVRILLGLEHGLPPGVALQEIRIVDGQMALSAVLQAALIRKKGIGQIRIVEVSENRAEIQCWRNDDPENRHTFSLTYDEAVEKGFTKSKGNKDKAAWFTHRANMLLHNINSTAGKLIFPESVIGAGYILDELGAETDENGRPLDDDDDTFTLPPIAGISPTAAPAPTPGHNPPEPVHLRPDPSQFPPPPQPQGLGDTRTGCPTALEELKDSIMSAHQQGLIPTQDAWDAYLKTINPKAESLADLTTEQVNTLAHSMDLVARLPALCEHAGIGAAGLQAGIAARGGKTILDLAPAQIVEMHDKLCNHALPFDRADEKGGPPPGNGLSTASAA